MAEESKPKGADDIVQKIFNAVFGFLLVLFVVALVMGGEYFLLWKMGAK